MQTTAQRSIARRTAGSNLWLEGSGGFSTPELLNAPFNYHVLESEDAVGAAMLNELTAYADEKDGDISVVLLGGRGAQAMYRRIAALTETEEIDPLLARD